MRAAADCMNTRSYALSQEPNVCRKTSTCKKAGACGLVQRGVFVQEREMGSRACGDISCRGAADGRVRRDFQLRSAQGMRAHEPRRSWRSRG